MNQQIIGKHDLDKDGNPAGGLTTGTGISISWQNGPLGRGTERKEPNGAFVAGVINAAIDRLEWYETICNAKFACIENASAIGYLNAALEVLNERTAKREARQVEGTHQA